MAKPFLPYEGPIVTREQAKALGLTRFFTRKPCIHGHVSQRYVSGSVCVQCNLEAAARWKSANQAEIKAYALSHNEQTRQTKKRWRTANPEWQQAYYALRKAVYNARSKAWEEANRERRRAIQSGYRARARSADGRHTDADITELYAKQRGRCAYCKVSLLKRYHVDHIQPLFLGGSNWPSNLQILCPRCNNRKNKADPLAYARRIGLLL